MLGAQAIAEAKTHPLADHKVSAALTRAIWLKFSSARHRNYNAMAKAKRTLAELLGQTCNACDKWFETMQGVMAHQSTGRKCTWYKKGKLKAVT